MPTHNYTYAELATAGTHPTRLMQKCLEHGYTNPDAVDLSDGTVDVTIDEGDAKATVLTNIEGATIPSLSVDTASQTIAGDGIATGTVTVSDSRGAAASGNTVKLLVPVGSYVPADADSFTLDGSGDATVTFGPCTGCIGILSLAFYYDSGETDSIPFTVRFGS